MQIVRERKRARPAFKTCLAHAQGVDMAMSYADDTDDGAYACTQGLS